MSIQIITALHEGIDGGGGFNVQREWTTGPRNLLKAVELLPSHRRYMTECYGNVGHLASWIEIDGVLIENDEIADLAENHFEPGYRRRPTRTEEARRLIDRVRSTRVSSGANRRA